MIDITKDIQPLPTFRNNSVKMMQRLKKTRRPIILTVNGKPEAVVQDAAAYQRLLEIAGGWAGGPHLNQTTNLGAPYLDSEMWAFAPRANPIS